MAENLKVTRYQNGDSIPYVANDNEWRKLKTGAYCSYMNDEANSETYGLLYNWPAVSKNNAIINDNYLAPEGWHVPTHDEWQTLVDYLGGNTIAGGKMKESGVTHWTSPNVGATNQSGFSALPGGYRDLDGKFDRLHSHCYFWSSTATLSPNLSWGRKLDSNTPTVAPNYDDMHSGFSVRCVKD